MKKKAKSGRTYNKKTVGLELNTFAKSKRWQIDNLDYVDQLSEEEKEWLSKFNNEYYGAAIKKGDEEALHKEEHLRKDCYARNNSNRRDLFTRNSMNMKNIDDITQKESIDE